VTRVVVLGGGFAGLEAMRVLEHRLGWRPDVELLLISDRNYLLFTPLLPQVASSLVEPRHIIQPIRDIRGARRRFRFRRDRVFDIDLVGRRVLMAEGVVGYDRLVIALGGETPTFGVPGVNEHAVNYKHLDEAVELRDHLIDLAEHADHEPDPATRRRMLTVCVVGGGYTGVELIAELYDLFASYVVPRYRGIDSGDYRLVLVEAGEQILRGVHPALAARAHRRLGREGIEVMTRTRVTRVLAGAVEINGGVVLPTGLTVWAAGIKGNPALSELKVGKDRLVAQNIVAGLGGQALARIDFAPRGMLVSLGEKDAVVEVMGLRFSGYFAWLFWNALHLFKLVGLRKQLQVALDWSLAQIFPRDSAMLRRASRCAVCSAHASRGEHHAA
jgi:NADH dehydrogenase